MPTNVFVDEDGTITAFGASTPASIEAEVSRLFPGIDLDQPSNGTGREHWEQESDHIARHITARNIRKPPDDPL